MDDIWQTRKEYKTKRKYNCKNIRCNNIEPQFDSKELQFEIFEDLIEAEVKYKLEGQYIHVIYTKSSNKYVLVLDTEDEDN